MKRRRRSKRRKRKKKKKKKITVQGRKEHWGEGGGRVEWKAKVKALT